MEKTRVFITGLGVVSPLGLNISSTWEAMINGVSGVDGITSFETDGFETRFAAEVKGFDATNYLEKKEARRMDRFAQFAAVAATEALAKAEIKPDEIDRPEDGRHRRQRHRRHNHSVPAVRRAQR